MARVGILLIVAVLIVGMAGCGGTTPTRYSLTLAVAGGNGTATDLTNASPYAAGTGVSIKAVANSGYRFVNWTAPAGTFGNTISPQTTFTMPAQNVTVTANFAMVAWDWYDLDAVRNNLTASYILMNDLDSTTAGYEELASPTANGGKGWQPIGTYGSPFTGTFDGQECEIRDLCSNRSDEGYVGLFGYVDDGGIIKNLGVVNANVYGALAGGLAGVNGGTMSDCYSTGNITGYMCVGSLVGANGGTVSDCYSTGNMTGYMFVGGLVGATVAFAYRFEQSIVNNSYYNYDEVLINGEKIITIGALFDTDFDEWLANDKSLDVNGRLTQENGYYGVNNVSDFKELLAFGQNGTLKFRLKNDLDLATEQNFYIPYLAGEFDGNGHKISNLSFNFSFVSQVGLFGYLAPDASVHDVAVESVNIIACDSVGGLVGASWNSSTVSNCYSTGNVSGRDQCVGGLVGVNGGNVSYSNSTGSVTGYHYVGGLVGANGGTLSNSYATGSVIGTEKVGGLIGQSTGSVSNSHSTGSVTGTYNVGGLVGLSGYTGTVSSSYSTGCVTGNRWVGGLVGCNYEGSVSDSYSTGSVTGTYNVGGLVGRNDLSTVSSSFWDTETSGQATSAGGTGKNTTEMKDITTFSGVAWNITAVADPGLRNLSYIWNIVDNVTYPFLSWQP